jgi:hypothetical protein
MVSLLRHWSASSGWDSNQPRWWWGQRSWISTCLALWCPWCGKLFGLTAEIYPFLLSVFASHFSGHFLGWGGISKFSEWSAHPRIQHYLVPTNWCCHLGVSSEILLFSKIFSTSEWLGLEPYLTNPINTANYLVSWLTNRSVWVMR